MSILEDRLVEQEKIEQKRQYEREAPLVQKYNHEVDIIKEIIDAILAKANTIKDNRVALTRVNIDEKEYAAFTIARWQVTSSNYDGEDHIYVASNGIMYINNDPIRSKRINHLSDIGRVPYNRIEASSYSNTAIVSLVNFAHDSLGIPIKESWKSIIPPKPKEPDKPKSFLSRLFG